MAAPILLDGNSRQLAQSSRTPIMVSNLSTTAVAYLDDDPSVSASSFDFLLTPGATITWQADKPLYACTDPGKACSVNLAFKSTELFDPSAVASAIQVKGAGTSNIFSPTLFPYAYGFPTFWPQTFLDRADDGFGNTIRFADYNYLICRVEISVAGSTPQLMRISYATDAAGSDKINYPTQMLVTPSVSSTRVCIPVLAPFILIELADPSGGPFSDPTVVVTGTNVAVEPLVVGYNWLNRISGFGANYVQNVTLIANTNIETEFQGCQGNIWFSVTNSTTGILNFCDLYEYDINSVQQLVNRQKFNSLGLGAAGLAPQCTFQWLSPMLGNQLKVILRGAAAGTVTVGMQYQPMSPSNQFYMT